MHVIRRIGLGYQAPVKVFRPSDAASSSASIYSGTYSRDAGRDVIARQPTPPQTVVRQPPPVQTTPQPTGVPGACDDLWSSLMAGAPPYVQSCMSAKPYHRAAFNDLCRSIVAGQTTLQTGTALWSNYVAQNCPPPSQTPPTPPPPPTGQPTIPRDTPTTIDVPDTGGGPSDSGEVPQEEEASRLRQLGSVVGIGLLLAVGLTYARKKGMLKLTKRRKRR